MSNKLAVIFINHLPKTFNFFKMFDIGTGYIALYDSEKSECLLCRILDDREVANFDCNKLVIKDYEAIIEKHVVIIRSDLNLLGVELLIKKK